MAVDLSRFQDTFFDESSEHVETIESGLLELEQRADDFDLLNRIFRAAHSMKGNAGMFGFTAISQLTHTMENVLDRLRNGEMRATRSIIDVLLQALDSLKALLEEARGQGTADHEAIHAVEERLVACQENMSAEECADTSAPSVRRSESQRDAESRSSARLVSIQWTPLAEVFQRGLDPSKLFQELSGLGRIRSCRVAMDRLPVLELMDPEVCYLSWSLDLETARPLHEIEAVFEFVREGSALTITEVPGEKSRAEERSEEEGHKPIGQILVEEGAISPEKLEAGLAKQKRIGEILVEEKAVTTAQVSQALEKQRRMDQAAKAKRGEASSVRVDTEKIDKLINLVGELVITQSMLTDLGNKFTMPQLPLLQERLLQLERNIRELQERVMSIRMLPIGTAFQRFPRLVRDLAAKSGKSLRLVTSGEETELDKTVIEAIGDPLTHLVRNSADHGIEPPEERRAKGKPEQGTIALHAFHEGGNICITVEDDGRGLNRDKILAKARSNGLVNESEMLTDEQVWQLIFRPGFSTADQVTDISGRGVGMDVVKRNIEALGGTVSVSTQEGRGSRFLLKLPLTLAIMDGMTVRIGPELYIVPLLSVTETLRPKPTDLQTIGGRGEVVNLRGVWLPIVRLYEVFGTPPGVTDPCQALLVIVESEGERIAVLVDELIGQQQVVIKSLEQNYRRVEGIAGATILGDGRVALIVDVSGLVTLFRNRHLVAA
ncbi:MAG: chemotaxis protein CheA [Nitrospirae bacterium]|nr:MAG: chemotaxis protein CheA [Nitrospirota bacterium]